ncbi:MAG: lamin tail domain-containing protein, partial [Flavobacteriales bacterium]
MKKLLSIFSLLVITQLSLFSQSDLVITEINYNPANQANVEYLEIYNNGLLPIELKGVSIPKGGRNSMEFTFPAHLLNIGEYVI